MHFSFLARFLSRHFLLFRWQLRFSVGEKALTAAGGGPSAFTPSKQKISLGGDKAGGAFWASPYLQALYENGKGKVVGHSVFDTAHRLCWIWIWISGNERPYRLRIWTSRDRGDNIIPSLKRQRCSNRHNCGQNLSCPSVLEKAKKKRTGFLPSFVSPSVATMATQVVAVAAGSPVATGSSGSAAGFLGSRKDVHSLGRFTGFSVSSRTTLENRSRNRFGARAAVLVRNPPSGTIDRSGNSENGSSRTGGGSNGAEISSRDTGNGAVMPVVVGKGAVYRTGNQRVAVVPKKKMTGINADTPQEREAEARAALRAADAIVYDPLSLYQRYNKMPFKVLGRALNISTTLGTFALSVFVDTKRGTVKQNMRMRAIQLRKKLTELGPTFVKIGQGLSTRPDLCPPEYLEELAELQDALPCFPDIEAFACIERELGAPLESMYSSITASPIAAASLGQVYKAILKSTGDVVAVKVQRPFIERSVGLDFYLLRGLCGLVDKYVDVVTSDVVSLLDEFARRVYEELNYVQEARNAIRFRKLYGDRADVLVPGIYWDYVGTKVLTMEWVDGVKLSDQAVIQQQGLDIIKLVDIGIQCSLRQLLEHGYFHADPHPGNLLATPDGRLAFLDFGMMSETPELARFAIIGHVVHLVNRDYEAMARDYYALDFLEPDVDVTPIVPALKNFFDDVLTATVSELNFKTIVDGLGAVLYQYPFNVPAYYALILRSLTVLEGLALFTDPNFKVLAASYPYFAKRLLTDGNPYLRDSLIELLFKDGSFRWNRLENLLVQGSKDSDYRASDVMQPVLNLLLGEGGEELRKLVEKEAIRVTEALVVGTAIEGYRTVPQPLRAILGSNLVRVKDSEEASILALRAQVLRIWGLLRSSSGFDPAMLQPIVEVLRIPEAQAMGGRVAGGITRRLAARALQQLLRPPSSPAAPA